MTFRRQSSKISALMGLFLLAGAVILLQGSDVQGQTGKAAPAATDKQRIARLEAQVKRQADQIERLEQAINRDASLPREGGSAARPTEGATIRQDNSASLNVVVSDATRSVNDQRNAVTRLEQSVQRQEQSVSTVSSAVSRLESRVSSLENRIR